MLWIGERARAKKGSLRGKEKDTKMQLSAWDKEKQRLLDRVVVSETDDETGLPSTRTAARASTYTADQFLVPRHSLTAFGAFGTRYLRTVLGRDPWRASSRRCLDSSSLCRVQTGILPLKRLERRSC